MTRKKKIILILPLFALSLIAIVWVWDRPRYTVKAIPIPQGLTMADCKLNDLGHVVVSLRVKEEYLDSFFWDDGDQVDICPDCREVLVTGFNNRDEAVGNFIDDSGNRKPFFWSPTEGFSELYPELLGTVTEPGDFIVPADINDHGEILMTAFRPHSPKEIPVGIASGNGIGPSGVSRHSPIGIFLLKIEDREPVLSIIERYVVGSSLNNSGWVAFRGADSMTIFDSRGNEVISELDDEGGTYHDLFVNDEGVLTGSFLPPMLEIRKGNRGGAPFVWSRQLGMRFLDFPKSHYTKVRGANNSGEFVMWGSHLTGPPKAISWIVKKIYSHSKPLSTKLRNLFQSSKEENWLWNGKEFVSLNSLLPRWSGWEIEKVSDINDIGQIVGSGSYEGRETVFFLTPIVESSTDVGG